MTDIKFGLYVGVANPAFPLTDQVPRWERMMRVAEECGFDSVLAVHHWLSHPAGFFQPLPLLARLASVPCNLQLVTGAIQLPLFSPVAVAEDAATVDVISGGRLVLGVGLGYREQLFEAAGARKSARVGRLEESIDIMRGLWSGQPTTYAGRHFTVTNGQLGMLPLQPGGPAVWIGAQSDAGVRRAARIGDAWLAPPQASNPELDQLFTAYEAELVSTGRAAPTERPLMRNMCIAPTRAAAYELAESELNDVFAWYRPHGLQEKQTVRLHLTLEEEVQDRAVVGSPDDCISKLSNYASQYGFNHMFLRLGKPGTQSFQAEDTIRFLGREVLPYVKQEVRTNL